MANTATSDISNGKAPVPTGFIAGTLVHTEAGLRPIEAIKVGERVLSRDEHTGAQGYKAVTGVAMTDAQRIIMVSYGNADFDGFLYVTPEHFFWTWRPLEFQIVEYGRLGEIARWVSAGDLPEFLRLSTHAEKAGFMTTKFDAYRFTLTPVHDQADNVIEKKAWSIMCERDINYPRDERSGFLVDFSARAPICHIDIRCADDSAYDRNMLKNTEGGFSNFSFKTDVFNIEVEDFNTYFVGTAGIWVRSKP